MYYLGVINNPRLHKQFIATSLVRNTQPAQIHKNFVFQFSKSWHSKKGEKFA